MDGQKMACILVVEDEEKLARFVELELMHEGYRVEKAANGREALEKAVEKQFDLILLDIMLPGLNGLEVLRRLQKERPTPVILLTARDAVMDKVAGLDAGAVDYVTKPFAIEELLARIRVVFKLHPVVDGTTVRRAGPEEDRAQQAAGKAAKQGIYTWGPLTLDEPRHRVDCRGHEITLTNREFLMLETLLRHQDIVLSRDTLLEQVCGYEYVGETNVIDVYIRYLRSKIDDVFSLKMIQTVRGVGYVIKEWKEPQAEDEDGRECEK